MGEWAISSSLFFRVISELELHKWDCMEIPLIQSKVILCLGLRKLHELNFV
jgi:hypothetical protein